ncbi:hypothetical protein G9A89_002634 [Geosiphon pyriformis]|nr:hypothetical protein G9A89_002634 [Geosiphon pyriformis]
MASQKLLHALLRDFGTLLNNEIFVDVRIIVGNGLNTKTFHAHSQILAARSSYFAVALSSNWVKRENNTIIFSKPNISPQMFEVILRHIYSGEILLDEYEVPIIIELLVAADELIMEDLISHLEDYLIEQYEEEMKENFFTLRETSNRHGSFKKLQNFFTDITARNPAAIFNSKEFTTLNKSALASVLCRDDLNLEESQIWEKIIEWGVAKSGSNIKAEEILNWTNENFEAFKGSIEELLPLIRFFHISSAVFYHKVKPFGRILPRTLYKDLLHHYLVPGSQQKSVDAQPFRLQLDIESKLLYLHNVRQLDHWVQDKDNNTPFQNQLGNRFDLLLRGSRDGFTPADFHRLCDDENATIIVIKVKETGQLIGGYSQYSWHSYDDWLDGEKSFIFSLGDGKAENAKLSKSVSEQGAFGSSDHGPGFGMSSIIMGGSDFQNSPGCSCQKDSSYEDAIMPGSENERVCFFVEEYEVFKIRKIRY